MYRMIPGTYSLPIIILRKGGFMKAIRIGAIWCAIAVLMVAGVFAQTEKGSITLWSQFADPNSMDSGSIAFYKALAETKAHFPKVEIDHVGSGGEAYKQKIPVAGAANELPDMFFWWGAAPRNRLSRPGAFSRSTIWPTTGL